MAVELVGIQTVEHLNRIFQLQNHDYAASSSFKQAVSALKRSGHARFRRGPSSSDLHAPSISSQSEEKLSTEPPTRESTASEKFDLKRSGTDTTSSFLSITSSVAGGSLEGSVSDGKQLSSLGIVAPTLSFSSRKPPLPSSHRKRHSIDRPSGSLQGSGRENNSVSRSGCHCCKRRKTGSKREVRRIPIIGSKVESIPADDYSWKKYGEKKIEGLPFPRVYYKCNTVKGCPARKRIELSLTDSKMLLVTYDREHRHHHTPTPVPASFSGLKIQ
ncbi:unnamed protein product [Lactuca saligna]|uniref:WRKY domain-containing protein n=1 Tax=Lactuca saligna TaxID=75948 RepID=A0AA36E7V6_LACSI|nr:unnamed protein product [Lactuca saligna]